MDQAQRITVDIPRAVVAEILLDRLTQLGAPRAITRKPADLPEIGQPWQGGLYAGLTIHDNAPYALVLLSGERESVTWSDAKSWAWEINGVLPTRFDALVLWQNLKHEFKEEAYWTDAQYARDESYAWFQHFSTGYQDYYLKDGERRARAVRRLPIE